MNADLLQSLLERKFVLALIAQLSSLALVGLDKLPGAEWADLNMVILGSFVLGNVSEHYARNQGQTPKE